MDSRPSPLNELVPQLVARGKKKYHKHQQSGAVIMEPTEDVEVVRLRDAHGKGCQERRCGFVDTLL